MVAVKIVKGEDGVERAFTKRVPSEEEIWNAMVRQLIEANENLEKNINSDAQAFYEGMACGITACIHIYKHLIDKTKVELPCEKAERIEYGETKK